LEGGSEGKGRSPGPATGIPPAVAVAVAEVVAVIHQQAAVDDVDNFGGEELTRREARLLRDFYAGLSAAAGSFDSPEVPPSLATWEQLPKVDAVPDSPKGGLSGSESPAVDALKSDMLKLAFRAGVDDVDRAMRVATEAANSGAGGEALQAALRRDDGERRQKVVGLLERGEVSEAKGLAYCGRRSVQLECPDGLAGGCGHEDNFVPISCDSRLCPDCMNSRIGELVQQYKPAVQGFENPTFGTWTIENVSDVEKGVDAAMGAFGRFRRRTIAPAGETTRDGTTKRWVWWRDGGKPAIRWKTKLIENGNRELARKLDKQYVQQNRRIPISELITSGIYAIDIKQKGPEEFNIHLHTIMDMVWTPQAALSEVWEDVSGAPVMDVRRIYGRDGDSIESALLETVGYAAKAPEFESIDDEVEYMSALKNRRLVQPFGDLHGNTPELKAALRCAKCGETPAWWTYHGLVDERRDNMEVVPGVSGDRPPP